MATTPILVTRESAGSGKNYSKRSSEIKISNIDHTLFKQRISTEKQLSIEEKNIFGPTVQAVKDDNLFDEEFKCYICNLNLNIDNLNKHLILCKQNWYHIQNQLPLEDRKIRPTEPSWVRNVIARYSI